MKKLALLGMALVFSLALCGAGYAYFTDTVTIEGTMTAGTLNVEFDNVSSSDPAGTHDPGQTPEMDVACTEVSPVSEDGDSFTVTVTNGYPCYSSVVTFDIVSTGSIAAKIETITISDGQGNTATITNDGDYADVDLGVTANKDVRITVTGIGEDTPIAAGGSLSGALNMHVVEKSVETDLGYDADQNASGSFTVTIVVTQFNAP